MPEPLDPSTLQAHFDQIKTLRGKKRTEAVAAVAALNEQLVPGLDPYLEDGNSATRTLAWQLLAEVRPETDEGRARLGATLARMLASSGPSLRSAAVDRLVALKGNVSGVDAPLARALARPLDREQLLKILEIFRDLALSDEELVAAVDPARDSWSPEVRAAASELVAARGGSPRPSVWASAPLAPAALQAVQKLGGTCREPFDPAIPRPIPDSWASGRRPSWSGTDPLGQCTEVPPAIWFLTRSVRWPDSGKFGFRKWGEERSIEFHGASENFDGEVDGERRLLLVMAYDPLAQFYYCFDLLDTSPDPAVWSIDHDGSSPGRDDSSFSGFCKKVWLR